MDKQYNYTGHQSVSTNKYRTAGQNLNLKMREILFKAKLKDWQTNPKHNKWVEGFYCNKQETTYCFESDYEKFPVKTQHYIIQERMLDWGLPNEFRLIEIDPKTVCQYTGMIDFEGNKIWEHDIIEEGCNGLVGSVAWDNKLGTYGLLGFGEDYVIKDAQLEWEVVGNIFDNPELIKT